MSPHHGGGGRAPLARTGTAGDRARRGPGAWYLDGGRAPVFVSVEAGQADLFLSAWLGIDLVTKGERVYRLLDAAVTFHRDLPHAGETIRYDIRIDRFVRQGDVHLFFFEFDGTIDGRPFLTMRNGCAGFFTADEIARSGGIVLTDDDLARRPGGRGAAWPLAAREVERYDDARVTALRAGDLAGCFGPPFGSVAPPLPGGRLVLFDRVLALEPEGGRFGLGRVVSEADVHPDDWFLTCHFVDDMVMPGTLMYECCAHTLRFFLMRMGWVADHEGVTWEPVPGIPAVLRCRGPVTAQTEKVRYEIEIKEVGYRPEPYVVADALMYADGRRIVRFVDMSMRLVGMDRGRIEARWAAGKRALYPRESILQFAVGRPSLAFGEPYRVYDEERRCARLPGPPYMFLDRITELGSEPFVCQPGGWFEAEYDVPPDAWYFRANRQPCMPFAVLLETALQPCGWLAAYLGSALGSPVDLKFRNLGGTAIWHEEVGSAHGTLTTRVRLTKVAEAGGMIIEDFAMEMTCEGRPIYTGVTTFGFFSAAALANQVGIRDAGERIWMPGPEELARGRAWVLERVAPRTPDDEAMSPGLAACLPGQAFLFNDEIELFVADGGPHGLGFVRARKRVDPEEWFFKAHFYQDPVVPGSIGLEAFIQCLEVVALERWPHLAASHRFVPTLLGEPHTWVYRGQVIPSNALVRVEAMVTALRDEPHPTVVADGFLHVDGLTIYEMRGFGIRMVPSEGARA